VSTVRYAAPSLTLGIASVAFVAAIWLAASAALNGSALLLAVALAIASFVAAAWAVGRIRRTRAMTPEAIITPPDDSV
jgi:hypothetical protein